MEIMSSLLEKNIQGNIAEYGDDYNRLKFLSEQEAKEADLRRAELIERLKGFVTVSALGSKIYSYGLSGGCASCGEGKWSCLFINGRCNCSCFYCPSSQNEECLPTSNSIDFNNHDEYISFLKLSDFTGCSISGGEPLLTPDLSLGYIKSVRREMGENIYLWMYTNGALVTEEILLKFKDAGLNELRIDIGATDYDLRAVEIAVKIMPVVTVEIPAVPEDMGILKSLAPKLVELGVKHVNLHQLRITPYNFEKLIDRNYTYIHGEKVCVLESEFAALEFIEYTMNNNIKLPVNYCSFVYKNRFQGLANRKRFADRMIKPFEVLTENGFIRTFRVNESKDKISTVSEMLRQKKIDEKLYEVSFRGGEICFHPELLALIKPYCSEANVIYAAVRQLPSVSYRNPFKFIDLTESRKVALERYKVCPDFKLPSDKFDVFDFDQIEVDPYLEKIKPFEIISKGLAEYY